MLFLNMFYTHNINLEFIWYYIKKKCFPTISSSSPAFLFTSTTAFPPNSFNLVHAYDEKM